MHHGAGDHWIDKGFNSYFQGFSNKWNQNEVTTVKLDCNNWNVTYYQNNEVIKSDKIEPNKHYYFAIMCCGRHEMSELQVIDNHDY